jgi:hypothetical protein
MSNRNYSQKIQLGWLFENGWIKTQPAWRKCFSFPIRDRSTSGWAGNSFGEHPASRACI